MPYDDILEFSKDLARRAGQLIVAERESEATLEHEFKAGDELVTSADIKADQFITAGIKAAFPGHQIISEELAPQDQFQEPAGPCWIIDPIDGTVNFAHGHRQSAVCIAFADQGRVRSGVVYNPFTDELFCARQGGGAHLNGQSIQVSREAQLRRALIATGFPYEKSALEPLVRRVLAVLRHCADIRRLGSAALDICWVACGRLDGYYESLSLWDFSAAQLIAREAGARFGHFLPPPEGANPEFHGKHILIANPQLFPQLLSVLQAAELEPPQT